MLRRLIGVASEIAEIAYLEPDDVTKALDEAETKVFEVAEERVTDSTRSLSDLLPLAMDKLQETFERGDIITGTATGFNDLDEILSGPATVDAQHHRRPPGDGQDQPRARTSPGTSPRPRANRC